MRGWKVWVEPSGNKWRCRWRGGYGSGQQTFLYKADADELHERTERNFQRRDAGLEPLKERPKTVRVSHWAEKYLEERARNPRQNTYLNFDKPTLDQFKEWALSHIGDTDLTAVTKADIYEWKDWLYKEKEYDNTTVAMRLSHLRAALSWAKERDWIAQNPAWDIVMPPRGAPGRCLTAQEVATALSIPPRDVALAFGLLFNSGMRRGEALTLGKKQVEPHPDSWRVHFEGWQTKNGQPKSVVLNPAAKAIIEEALSLSKGDLVFEGLTKDRLDYWADKISEKIGPFTPHDTKHTFCTHWMRATGDFYGLKQMTGNSDQSLRVYRHLALGTPRGIASFPGFAPAQPLNASEGRK
jgi:integrase